MESRLERARPWQSGVALRLPPQSIEGGVPSWATRSLTKSPLVSTFRSLLPFRDTLRPSAFAEYFWLRCPSQVSIETRLLMFSL